MVMRSFFVFLLVSGVAPLAQANPAAVGFICEVMPPTDSGWDPTPRIQLGELITTIQAADGTLEAHKGTITLLANGSYSVNINYLLDDVVYRVNYVINQDGTGAVNAAGEALISNIAARSSLYQTVNQQSQALQQALPSAPPSSYSELPKLPQLSDCTQAWIGFVISALTKSWLGALWGLYKIITACF